MVVCGRAARNTANIKNRQPIGQMFVKADQKSSRVLPGDHRGRAECKEREIYRRCESLYFLYLQAAAAAPWDRSTASSWAVSSKALAEIWMEMQQWMTLKEKGALTFDFNGEEVVLTRGRSSDRRGPDGGLRHLREDNYSDGCPGYEPDSGTPGGRLCARADQQDPDHEKGSRLRGDGPHSCVCRGK